MNEILQCVEPAQVLDEDYLAALAADARPQFTQHLAGCPFCQQELAAYRNLDDRLHQQFAFVTRPSRTMCPEASQLGEYALNRLDGVALSQIERHLASCRFCPGELAMLRPFLLEADPAIDLQLATSGGLFAGLRRVIATLLGAGSSGSLNYVQAGVRGSDEGLPQTYQAEEVYVTLTIQQAAPRSRDLMVLGLVQRDNFPLEATAGARVRLRDAGLTLATEEIDDAGNFIFPQVTAPAQFDLEITLDDKIVTVPGLSRN